MSVIKETIGKEINCQQLFQKKKNVRRKKGNHKSRAENFNKYFTENGPSQAKKVDSFSLAFDK